MIYINEGSKMTHEMRVVSHANTWRNLMSGGPA